MTCLLHYVRETHVGEQFLRQSSPFRFLERSVEAQ